MTGITSRYCQNETVSNLTVVRSGTVYTVAKLVEWVTFDTFFDNVSFDYFMNVETFDQVGLTEEQVGDSLKFVKENEMVKICSHNGNVFAIEPPLFVELVVTETEPGFAGNTAQGATKPAIVETGAQVMVPLFVNQGDKLKIDTRTGEYLSRV